MTKIEIFFEKDDIVKFTAKGHSNYASLGEDIVCAGISTLIQTAILALKKMFNQDIVEILKEGNVELNIPKQREAQLILQTIIIGLRDIESEYPKNIRIKEIRDVY